MRAARLALLRKPIEHAPDTPSPCAVFGRIVTESRATLATNHATRNVCISPRTSVLRGPSAWLRLAHWAAVARVRRELSRQERFYIVSAYLTLQRPGGRRARPARSGVFTGTCQPGRRARDAGRVLLSVEPERSDGQASLRAAGTRRRPDVLQAALEKAERDLDTEQRPGTSLGPKPA
ncbi:hypothetical protein PtB15_11B442 [Puccinia triticina]|nr:hypothetical protein PtB15_11B442 [Puccinia triticina]